MKILFITDTTKEQINGVVRTLKETINELKQEYEISIISPKNFYNICFPFYKEIKLSINIWNIGKLIEKENPEYIHIVTEGPVGIAGKLYCDKMKYNYTTSYHTRFPEYIESMYKINSKLIYPYFKWFHKNSKNVLVPTNDIKLILENKGFTNIKIWNRGVNSNEFNYNNIEFIDNPLPILLYVGRISKEKNIEEFLNIKLGTRIYKCVVGDGPYLSYLEEKYLYNSDVVFYGKMVGKELAKMYRRSDVCVFPSKSDTFGLTILESISCGCPVAAFNEPGPKSIIKNGINGYYSDSLKESIEQCLLIKNRKQVKATAHCYTWKKSTYKFKKSLIKK